MSEDLRHEDKESLTKAISSLAHEIHELRILNSVLAISKSLVKIEDKLTDLETKLKEIMSAISDFAAKQTAFNDRQDAAITALGTDIETLNKKITDLQNSAGQITPEDQKLLDDIQARASSISDKLDALDALTPPPVPTNGGGGGENPPPGVRR